VWLTRVKDVLKMTPKMNALPKVPLDVRQYYSREERRLEAELDTTKNLIISGRYDIGVIQRAITIINSLIVLIDFHIRVGLGVRSEFERRKQEYIHRRSSLEQLKRQLEVNKSLQTFQRNKRVDTAPAFNGAKFRAGMKRTQSQACTQLSNPYVVCIDDARLKVRN
jgi:hypothetical protein